MALWPQAGFKDKEAILYCPINYNDYKMTVAIMVLGFIMILPHR